MDFSSSSFSNLFINPSLLAIRHNAPTHPSKLHQQLTAHPEITNSATPQQQAPALVHHHHHHHHDAKNSIHDRRSIPSSRNNSRNNSRNSSSNDLHAFYLSSTNSSLASSPVMMPDPSFNRHPLSDTPVVSHSNSPSLVPHSGSLTPAAGMMPIHTGGSGSAPSSANHSGKSSPNTSNSTPGACLPAAPRQPHHHNDSSIPLLTLPPRRAATTLDVPGLTKSKVSPDGSISARDVESKLVIVMVGLPARGKSYVTKKLCRYLKWQQHGARIFNVGNTRRKANQDVGPANQPLPDPDLNCQMFAKSPQSNSTNNTTGGLPSISESIPSPSGEMDPLTDAAAAPAASPSTKAKSNPNGQSADFFSPDNPETFALREKWAMDTLEDLLDYVLDGNGSVGILDATNTTIARRRSVLDRINERSGGRLKVLFLESVCSDNAIIESNIRLKLSGPDYKDVDTDVAIKDFVTRMHNYEKVYQTIGPEEEADDDFQYIKMIDVGRKVVCYNIQGFLAGQVVFFLLNFNLAERQIWITRHGESEDNAIGRIGGDAPLTARGCKFAAAAARFMQYQKKKFRQQQLKSHIDRVRILQRGGSEPTTPISEPEERNFCVWTSMLKRSVETGEAFSEDIFDIKEMRMLNELGAGICDGMTYPEIKAKYPAEYAARMADKVQYRYPGPGGESYLDVINRLRPVIVEVERMTDNALIIGHRVVCRVLLAYFMNLGREAIGDLDVPLHTLYCLEPKPYGVAWEMYVYNDETDWFYKMDKNAMAESNMRARAPAGPKAGTRDRQYSVMPTAASAAAAGGPETSGRDRQYSVVPTAAAPAVPSVHLQQGSIPVAGGPVLPGTGTGTGAGTGPSMSVNDIADRLGKMTTASTPSRYQPDRGPGRPVQSST